MLSVVYGSLEDILQSKGLSLTGADRIILFAQHIGDEKFSRADYIRHFKTISPPSYRELNVGKVQKNRTPREARLKMREATTNLLHLETVLNRSMGVSSNI